MRLQVRFTKFWEKLVVVNNRSPAFTRVLGMNHEEALKLCHDAYKSLLNSNFHLYKDLYVTSFKLLAAFVLIAVLATLHTDRSPLRWT